MGTKIHKADMAIKEAGDELDRLAVDLRARDDCSYVKAFRRICALNPALAKQYQTGEKS